MSKEIFGKVSHFPTNNGVEFEFREIDKKKINDDEETIFIGTRKDLAFEIWNRFKSSKVKITISKIK